MKSLSLTVLLTSFVLGSPVIAQNKDAAPSKDTEKVDQRLAEAGKAFSEIMAAKDNSIPDSVLSKAQCVVIIPGMVKGGFIVAGQGGKGAVSCRGANKTGWGAPAMLEMGGGSVGFQAGASSTDVVMLVMDKAGMDSLLKDKFTLGGDASVAAGPVGRSATAETDAAFNAKILSYSRSKGVFGGVALKGSTLKQDNDANKTLYGTQIDAKNILAGTKPAPAAAAPMLQALNQYSPAGK
jgi:lipid-binding SYLF domain-containing protein